MSKLRNGHKGDSNSGSLHCEFGILPLSKRARNFDVRQSHQVAYPIRWRGTVMPPDGHAEIPVSVQL